VSTSLINSFGVSFSWDWVCRRIVEDSQEAIIFADREGIIRLWNMGSETMFGHPGAEAVGQPLDLIIPENLRGRHNEGYRKVMAAGVTRYDRELLAVPGLRKDGTRVSLEFSLTLIRSPEGEILGTAAIIRDVTARWERDKTLKQRLAALEAQIKLPTP